MLSIMSAVNLTDFMSTLLPPMPDTLCRLARRLAFRRAAPKLNHLHRRKERAQVRQPLGLLGILVLQDQHLQLPDMSLSSYTVLFRNQETKQFGSQQILLAPHIPA